MFCFARQIKLKIKNKLNIIQIKKYNNWRFLVTSTCNSNCFFCHRDGTGIKRSFINFQLFKKINQKWGKYINKVRFAGGEALLHPDIWKMVEISLSLTSDVSIGTNGLLLSKYIEQIQDSKLQKITVSLHSLKSKTFEKITGIKGREHSNIIRSIKKLSKFIKIKLNVVILENLNTSTEELKKLIDFAVQNDLNIEFEELDLGSIKNFDFKKYHYPPLQLVKNIKKIKKVSFKFDVVESVWESTIKNSKIGIQKSHCFNGLCKKCILSRPILVYPNGNINRCRLGKPLIKNVDVAL